MPAYCRCSRRADLFSRIIGFRAYVRASRPHYKLGQDENRETFGEIAATVPDPELTAWMATFARSETPP